MAQGKPGRPRTRPEPKAVDPKQVAEKAKQFDRDSIGEKTRVWALARELDATSPYVVEALHAIGIVKVAQAALTPAEVTRLLDHLAGDGHTPGDDDKLRHRVEKNVENEIEQIKQKVDRELEAEVVTPAEEAPIIPQVEVEKPAPVAAAIPVFMPPKPLEVVEEAEEEDEDTAAKKRRRGRRGTGRGRKQEERNEEVEQIEEPKAIAGSTRLEAQRRRRAEMRDEQRKKRHIVSEAEFLARRESVERTMVVRERERKDHPGTVTQVGVLEDGMLVEHFVTSETQASMVGNIYLGRVQNVLPSMEAAFIDIGQGRNAVLYAGEVNWRSLGLGGRGRRIEQAFHPGDQVLVQVSKDPVGHKGARLTMQVSLAGRYLVYVPGGRSAGISRKLPAGERARLKKILKDVMPEHGGAIIRTAAEGVHEDQIAADVKRLDTLWNQLSQRAEKQREAKSSQPVTLYEEPNMLVKVVRDLFNEDFHKLVVDGKRSWNTVHAYVQSVAPELLERLEHFDRSEHDGRDAFEEFRVDEQIKKALSRKVWLPSGGTLVIDRTEAMTVIDVNTGKFTGAGGNLEETVTRNNLEAAEEIVRQMRLRDLGGMIVVDFIDMVLPENQDLVLRRLTEALGRDRTRHQISEVTSLGLVQMTRKRLGTGLLETFTTECEHCEGRGVIIHDDPIEEVEEPKKARKKHDHGVRHQDPKRHPAVVAMHKEEEDKPTLEELASAVVVDNDAAELEEETPTPKRQKKQKRRSSRRAQKNDTSAEEIAHAALEKAEAEEPDEPSGRDHMPETYEEAKQKFEASPRRKRRVRGNSRSDHKPKPEDFEPKADETSQRAAEQQPEETPEVKVVSRKGRRRAIRRSQPQVERVQKGKPEQEKGETSQAKHPRRGRRRATRRARR
ncbi:ribonuclease E [Corynebacterium pelargi]|uniref:Ribonuclease E n=1 Tax=Corynebacterium pelargi TaxID=1471400 RepID=A0A410W786_9CORY|nr:Ribonuclease G [Corynebacterium pelargi]GGG72086.1 ribonuclease E [Corynebacterium pelargi]